MFRNIPIQDAGLSKTGTSWFPRTSWIWFAFFYTLLDITYIKQYRRSPDLQYAILINIGTSCTDIGTCSVKCIWLRKYLSYLLRGPWDQWVLSQAVTTHFTLLIPVLILFSAWHIFKFSCQTTLYSHSRYRDEIGVSRAPVGSEYVHCLGYHRGHLRMLPKEDLPKNLHMSWYRTKHMQMLSKTAPSFPKDLTFYKFCMFLWLLLLTIVIYVDDDHAFRHKPASFSTSSEQVYFRL